MGDKILPRFTGPFEMSEVIRRHPQKVPFSGNRVTADSLLLCCSCYCLPYPSGVAAIALFSHLYCCAQLYVLACVLPCASRSSLCIVCCSQTVICCQFVGYLRYGHYFMVYHWSKIALCSIQCLILLLVLFINVFACYTFI